MIFFCVGGGGDREKVTERCRFLLDAKKIQESAWNGRVDFVKVLIQNGADVNANTDFRCTAIHAAAKMDILLTV